MHVHTYVCICAYMLACEVHLRSYSLCLQCIHTSLYVCGGGGGGGGTCNILFLSLVSSAAGSLRHGQLPSLLWFLPPRSESAPLHATYLHMYSTSLGQLHDSVTETSGIASQSALYMYVVCTVCDFSLVCLPSFITPVNSHLLLSSHSPPNISSSHLAHTIIPHLPTTLTS